MRHAVGGCPWLMNELKENHSAELALCSLMGRHYPSVCVCKVQLYIYIYMCVFMYSMHEEQAVS